MSHTPKANVSLRGGWCHAPLHSEYFLVTIMHDLFKNTFNSMEEDFCCDAVPIREKATWTLTLRQLQMRQMRQRFIEPKKLLSAKDSTRTANDEGRRQAH